MEELLNHLKKLSTEIQGLKDELNQVNHEYQFLIQRREDSYKEAIEQTINLYTELGWTHYRESWGVLKSDGTVFIPNFLVSP
jgi:hypothetical protein